jgi:hypothetical protein
MINFDVGAAAARSNALSHTYLRHPEVFSGATDSRLYVQNRATFVIRS